MWRTCARRAQVELRVREVPLQLTGPIPEGSLLEALDPGVAGPRPRCVRQRPAARRRAAPRTPATRAAGTGPCRRRRRVVTTPQAAPERVARRPARRAASAAPPPPPAP